MSCWKCGKDTPEGETECSPDCAPAAPPAEAFVQGLPSADPAAAGKLIEGILSQNRKVLWISIPLDADALLANPAAATAAVNAMPAHIEEAVVKSGLIQFVKKL